MHLGWLKVLAYSMANTTHAKQIYKEMKRVGVLLKEWWNSHPVLPAFTGEEKMSPSLQSPLERLIMPRL